MIRISKKTNILSDNSPVFDLVLRENNNVGMSIACITEADVDALAEKLKAAIDYHTVHMVVQE